VPVQERRRRGGGMSAETFLNGRVQLHCGDCLEVMDSFEENSVDSCVCDPPYHLQSIVKRFAKTGRTDKTRTSSGPHQRTANGFMNKVWDGGDIAFQVSTWEKVFRVLKPGAYVVAFSSSRTFGRMSEAISGAGFITHPLIGQLLESSTGISEFLVSLNPEQQDAFGRLIDRADFGGVLGWIFGQGFPKAHRITHSGLSDLDRVTGGWEGWRYGGQALKPALEPIYVGQKPFSEINGAANVQRWGTGALNIDACRIHADDAKGFDYTVKRTAPGAMQNATGERKQEGVLYSGTTQDGRWPANVMTDGSAQVFDAFPNSDAGGDVPQRGGKSDEIYGEFSGGGSYESRNDAGSAARFFWSSKAVADDRLGSRHPTVKPVDLIEELITLVTPPGGLCLDCFAGTGSLGEAAYRRGFRAALIEREPEYQADIRRRMALCMAGPEERKRESIKAKIGNVPFEPGSLFALGSSVAE
jgi:DNA modification methylase